MILAYLTVTVLIFVGFLWFFFLSDERLFAHRDYASIPYIVGVSIIMAVFWPLVLITIGVDSLLNRVNK